MQHNQGFVKTIRSKEQSKGQRKHRDEKPWKRTDKRKVYE